MQWAICNRITCWSASCRATFFTSTRSFMRGRCNLRSPAAMAGRPWKYRMAAASLLIAFQNASSKDAAAMRYFHGRPAIAAGDRKLHLPLINDRVDVKNVARHEALQQVMRLHIAHCIDDFPEFVRAVYLLDPDGASH